MPGVWGRKCEMRHLLNTLFILTEDAYLSLENENIIVWQEKRKLGQVPIQTLENIVTFSYKGASPALMGACAKRGIGLAFCTPHGRFLARVSGESRGNVLLRRKQYRLADDAESRCIYARDFITGKLHNSRVLLARALRDHRMGIDAEAVSASIKELAGSVHDARQAADADALRGIEGNAAHMYFSVFGELILQDKAHFAFHGRVKRPPDSPVNALLSFAYTLLAHDCASALEAVGLDAYVGFLHTDRAGRTSLALDLMEELRSIFADRFVLTLINNRVLRAADFETQEDGAVLLANDGRKKFLSAWQEKKRETITHPFLDEKISWGLVPYAQSLLLARTIRGDISEYPAFLWK